MALGFLVVLEVEFSALGWNLNVTLVALMCGR